MRGLCTVVIASKFPQRVISAVAMNHAEDIRQLRPSTAASRDGGSSPLFAKVETVSWL